MTRPIVGWLLAALSAAMLALIFGEYLSPLSATTFGIGGIAAVEGGAAVSSVLPASAAFRAGLRAGDRIGVMDMGLGERLRLVTGHSPIGTVVNVPVERGGQTTIVPLVSQGRAAPLWTDNWPYLLSAIITLCVVGLIGFRKPSVATAFLVLFGMGTATTGGIVGDFSWLNGAWFTVAATFILAAFSALPIVALLPFIVRFPEPPATASGKSLARAADIFFCLGAIVFAYQVIYEPVLFASWPTFNYLILAFSFALVLVFTALVYRRASGAVRTRIGWVVAGLVISATGTIAFNFAYGGWGAAGNQGTRAAIEAVSQLLSCALPLSLGYAILRHRVIDVGFVINRTVVYGIMVAIVLTVVGFVDWLATRLIDQQRLAVALEAIVTIGFGIALNWLHARMERLVDRFVFRARHLAEKRVEYRIGALGFAASGTAIDEALAVEAPSIVALSSAAVFRRVSSVGSFLRTAATQWDDDTTASIDEDSLLVRTLRSLERSFILEDVAVNPERSPIGQARPALAIPIITQHELTGFVLYGNRLDGALPDPEEISLLNRLCIAASGAYGAVEARQWRDRAAALEGSLASGRGTAEATTA